MAYRIGAFNHIRLRTGGYDRKRPLVIDPKIVFDQSFSGSGMSTAAGLARDTQGNLYVAGTTNSTDLATVNPIRNKLGTAPLLVTADASETWGFPSLGPARFVSAIAAAPSAMLVVYAATPLGVFMSSDGNHPASVLWVSNGPGGGCGFGQHPLRRNSTRRLREYRRSGELACCDERYPGQCA